MFGGSARILKKGHFTVDNNLKESMAERFGQDLILLEKLAAGGMAEVYRARQLGYGGFEKTVALKRILQNYAENEEFKSMFRMEANLSGLLQHSNIAQIFGNGEFDGYLYLLMEFIDGKNVRQLLARADKKKLKIPVELALFIVSETAKGLNYAHNFHDEKTNEALEIVHRDMSPQNVMLSYDGAVKVVDFGIAKAAARSGQTKAGVLKGKFGYMSPEQAQGMNLDRRTDIFALGIILFELLTQRRLFTSDDDFKTLQLVRDCRVPRPSKYNPDVSPALDSIVLKALKKEKSERYATAEELYADLTRFLYQKYPKFLPTDMSKFIRDLFAEDIVEERKKREKNNAEIPPRLVQALNPKFPRLEDAVVVAPSAATAKVVVASPSHDATQVQDNDATQLGTENGEESRTRIEDSQTDPPIKSELDMPDVESGQSNESHTYTLNSGVPGDSNHIATAPTAAARPPKRSTIRKETNSQIVVPSLSNGKTDNSFILNMPNGSNPVVEVPSRLTTSRDDLPPPSSAPQESAPQNGGSQVHNEANSPNLMRRVRMKPRQSNGMSAFGKMALLVIVSLGGFYYAQENHLLGPKPASECPDGSHGPECPTTSPIVRDPEPQSTSTVQKNDPIVKDPRDPPTTKDSVSTQPAPPTDPVVAPPVEAVNPLVKDPVPVVAPPSDPKIPVRAAGTGYLEVNSVPRANEIYVNGVLLRDAQGQALGTPLKKFPYPAGKYNVVLKNTFFGNGSQQSVTVQPDRIVTIDILLK